MRSPEVGLDLETFGSGELAGFSIFSCLGSGLAGAGSFASDESALVGKGL